MDMMEFMDLVYDGEKLSAMVEHGMAPTAVLRAQIHGLVVLKQLKRCGLPQYFHNFHVAGVTIGEFMTLGREENGWLLQRLVPTPRTPQCSAVTCSSVKDLQRTPERRHARNFLRQILEAVRHCHSRGVIHMDLKEENILVDLDTEKLKLIDFGSAHPIGDDVHSEFYGTKAYGPPERISSRGLFRARPAEVWSLGILLYSMVHGNAPSRRTAKSSEGDRDSKPGSLTPAGT
ncbi:hypothetical protein Q5P01_000327 [Channa striata]|uniref:non-specific serine/threonine protein kinase n=1 Tax=Channa striata TaxID=64152 RepID=A0AA88LFX1_CHASR|nr:hypothetical protein Q5P01_000327 [Channa striata]